MTRKPEKELSFDKSLAQLEKLVHDMESGALPLEKMMEQFEEGMRLVSFCSAKLNEIEKKIEIMVKKGDKLVTEAFEVEGKQEPGASSQEPEFRSLDSDFRILTTGS